MMSLNPSDIIFRKNPVKLLKGYISAISCEVCPLLATFDRCMLNKGAVAVVIVRDAPNWHLQEDLASYSWPQQQISL